MNLKKSSLLIAVSYIIKIASGLIINKLLAVFVGPTGIAIIWQFRSFVQMMTTLSTGGVNSGVVKLIASNKDSNRQEVIKIKNLSLSITLVCSIFLSIVIFAFDESLGRYLFSTGEYVLYIDIFAISLILFSLNQILIFFINGENNTRLYTVINIMQSIVVLILSVFFVILYKLEGALLVVGISQILISFVSLYYVHKNNIFSFKNFSFLLKNEHINILFKYALVTFVNAISVALSLILIRNIMTEKFGLEQTGLWQSVWNIGEVYLGFVTMLLSVHFYPKIASLINQKDALLAEVKKITLFVVAISFMIIITTFFFKKWIVLILYSESFLESLFFFKYQLIGDFFKIVSWIFGYYMLSVAAIKPIIIATILSSLAFVMLTDFFTTHYGILGVNYAYTLVYLTYLIFTFLYFRRDFERK